MKALSWISLVSVAVSVRGQYYSEGWQPGQPGNARNAEPTFVPQAAPSSESFQAPPAAQIDDRGPFDLTRILTWKPVSNVLSSSFGFNITERLAAVRNVSYWDTRVPLITDDNYVDLIVNEELTEEEEKERVWAIVVSATAGKQGGITTYVDEAFDDAYNLTLVEGDLQQVRWGRIDYMNVTYLTTKWNVWQAPVIVILTDRGRTLRFYRPQHIRLRDAGLREVMKSEAWKTTPPWQSSFAPGGDDEYIIEFFAVWMAKGFNIFRKIPSWMMYIASGSVASFVISFMHRGDNQKLVPRKPEATTTEPTTPATPAVPAQKPLGTKSRKHKK